MEARHLDFSEISFSNIICFAEKSAVAIIYQDSNCYQEAWFISLLMAQIVTKQSWCLIACPIGVPGTRFITAEAEEVLEISISRMLSAIV